MSDTKSPVPLSKQLDVPPLWLFGTLIAIWLFDRLLPILHWGGGWSRGLGAGLILAAFALAFWSFATFRRHETPIHPRRKPTTLLTTGPYALSRNPIYLAMAMIALGAAFIGGSLGALIPVPIFVWIVQTRFIAGEEFHIAKNFGEDWRAYTEQTRRWF